MSEILLHTKLFIPPTRPNLVLRPRLIELLNAGLQSGHKLTLVSAPAGFGKTTLISDWVEDLRLGAAEKSPIVNLESKIKNRVTWFSLDERDNDLTCFLTYLVAALNRVEGIETSIGEGARTMLQSPRPPPAESILTSLINDVTSTPERIILVLDDYHLIESAPVDDALTFLLENIPRQMHLVLATRVDPNLSIARYRARSQLTELRAADLRFSSSEAAEFLNQSMGLGLSTADITKLETRTEGWIAGLQLAALALQGSISTRGYQDAASFIESFTGSHHFIMDYLVEDVLKQQPENVQNFLLQTAVLNRLTGPLCDALTGQRNGQKILADLARANLFIVPLDESRRWYRYHHLFGELLRQQLRAAQPDWPTRLHRRASNWYAQNGLTEAAIEHALRAGDDARAAQLVATEAEAMRQRGELTKLRGWLRQLPLAQIARNPLLAIFHAEALAVSGEQAAAEQSLQAAELALADDPPPHADGEQPSSLNNANLHGRIAVIRALLAFYRGDTPAIIEHAQTALATLPEADLGWRIGAASALGDAQIVVGDMPAAYQAHLKSLQATQAAGNLYISLITNLKLAVTLRNQGQLTQALEICRQQQQIIEASGISQTMVAGWLLAIWGDLLAEQNDLEQALSKVKRGAALVRRGGQASDVAMRAWSLICLARVHFSCHDLAGLNETAQEMMALLVDTAVPPWLAAMMTPWQARLWLAEGNLAAVAQWVAARKLRADDALSFLREAEHLLLARFLLAQEKFADAAELLARLQAAANAGGRTASAIESGLLRAHALHANGQPARALDGLAGVLDAAEAAGFVRLFVDEGTAIVPLLEGALGEKIAPAYVRRLLAAITAEAQAPVDIEPPAWVDPLSEREVEVLACIAEGLTNRQIATRLYLSLHTVKVHTRNIYSKLDVHSRIQAVAKARELQILPSA